MKDKWSAGLKSYWRAPGAIVLLIGIDAGLSLSCVSIQTPYKEHAPHKLSSEQLVEELAAVSQGINVTINQIQYLLATRPEPAYVLTSSTTDFFGTIHANASVYSIPQGGGSFTHVTGIASHSGLSTTNYYYEDVNSFARSMNSLAIAINQAKAASYRNRGKEVLDEIQLRIKAERETVNHSIDDFYERNPEMNKKRNLIAAILPWVSSENPSWSADAKLQEAGKIAASLERGPGMTGKWYGVLAQTSTLPDGTTRSFNRFFHIDFIDSAGTLLGKGELGSGERIEVAASVMGSKFEGVVTNVTSLINATLSGKVSGDQVVVEYQGSGRRQQVKGTAVFLR